jgi:hypothetical protein
VCCTKPIPSSAAAAAAAGRLPLGTCPGAATGSAAAAAATTSAASAAANTAGSRAAAGANTLSSTGRLARGVVGDRGAPASVAYREPGSWNFS